MIFFFFFLRNQTIRLGIYWITKTKKLNRHQIEPEEQYHPVTPLSKPEAPDRQF